MISKLVSQIIINEDLVQYSLGALYLSLVPKTKLYLVNNYETFMAFFLSPLILVSYLGVKLHLFKKVSKYTFLSITLQI